MAFLFHSVFGKKLTSTGLAIYYLGPDTLIDIMQDLCEVRKKHKACNKINHSCSQ